MKDKMPEWLDESIFQICHMINEEQRNLSIEEKIYFCEQIKKYVSETVSPMSHQPIDNVLWVDIKKVKANDYNPNSVASQEMSLLATSILHDGYTQPVVTVYDDNEDKYIIIDGFHRYFTCLNNKKIFDRNQGLLPVVVLQKDMNDRMASTVRHNRARGKHSIGGMSNMVFNMLDNGWADNDICNELGMQPDELLRLKHITGFSKLFENAEYSKSWTTKHQILLKKQQEAIENN
tara:strand:- start:442 stop:1143 length:702 start_codon:yes stop_codon:yes gene_type:complete